MSTLTPFLKSSQEERKDTTHGGQGENWYEYSKEQYGFLEAEGISGRPSEELPDSPSSQTRGKLSGRAEGGRGNRWKDREKSRGGVVSRRRDTQRVPHSLQSPGERKWCGEGQGKRKWRRTVRTTPWTSVA